MKHTLIAFLLLTGCAMQPIREDDDDAHATRVMMENRARGEALAMMIVIGAAMTSSAMGN